MGRTVRWGVCWGDAALQSAASCCCRQAERQQGGSGAAPGQQQGSDMHGSIALTSLRQALWPAIDSLLLLGGHNLLQGGPTAVGYHRLCLCPQLLQAALAEGFPGICRRALRCRHPRRVDALLLCPQLCQALLLVGVQQRHAPPLQLLLADAAGQLQLEVAAAAGQARGEGGGARGASIRCQAVARSQSRRCGVGPCFSAAAGPACCC